ncbi:PTS sugar transporter subunit IIA [Spiribacter halobius]|uniref:PTS fructose transporter subunit IIA n=1 Tax=Sediminicurvatus halobius TaxID=2182432 RepID=A0A2U2N7N8_9GAMM|nr:PTS fructose transporter subunit IIA [Spiribacter halobius]PWG65211.1 PTS fructose transporter subunit IIA [Spiribacter halobius]UEX78834.1 PTS fructose transporter subunit IIA [Spiribacter halobius]
MSVGVLLVTHNRLGEELLRTARTILGGHPLATGTLGVPQDSDPSAALQRGLTLLGQLDDGDGALILTDAFGSTPSNVAVRLGQQAGAPVISGVNLPMLLRVLNYPQLPLEELRAKALSGGRDGILLVEPSPLLRQDHGG